jgi:uncharacterized repeat protein (TIGR02543 family)
LLLSVAIMLSVLIVPATAAESRYTYELTFESSGSVVKNLTALSAGDTVKVTLTVTDTSAGTTFQAYMLDFQLYAKGLQYKEGRAWNLEKDIQGAAGYNLIVSGANEVDFKWTDNYISRACVDISNPLVMTCTYTVTNPTIAEVWLQVGEIFPKGSSSAVSPTRITPFDLSLNLDGGTLSGASIAGTYYDGTTVTLPSATKTGYDLVNWTDGNGNYYEAGATYTVRKDVTLTARWQAQTVNVVLSDGQGNTADCTGTYGEDYTLPANIFTRTGYTFAGWSVDSATYQPGATYPLRGDVTFTAVWTENKVETSTDNKTETGTDSNTTDDTTNTTTNTNTGTSTGTNTGSNIGTGNGSNSGTTNASVTTATSAVANTVIDGNTETVTYEDGSTTTVATAENGTVTTTHTTAAGVTGETVKDQAGTVTSVSATIPAAVATAAAEKNETVSLPITVQAAATTASAPAIAVNVARAAKPVKVEIPVENVSAGVVAVIVNEDGTEEIVKTSVITDNGVELALSGSATVKIVDNTKTFDDVASTYWGNEAITFATSRTIFNGTSASTFTPEGTMTRGMLAQVLHNMETDPETVSLDAFQDVDDDDWYAEAVAWAADAGIVTGYGNGTFGPTDDVTRQQVAVMLWRYAGQPTASADSINAFGDAASVGSYAQQAMAWAIENGIINGINGNLKPESNATRTQVATMMMRYCNVLTQ